MPFYKASKQKPNSYIRLDALTRAYSVLLKTFSEVFVNSINRVSIKMLVVCQCLQ